MIHAESGGSACRDHDDGQPDTETQHQGYAQGDLAELQAEQQNGDCRRTRDQPACEAESDDLSSGDSAVGEAATDCVGMLALVGVLEAWRVDVQATMVVIMVTACMMALPLAAAVVVVVTVLGMMGVCGSRNWPRHVLTSIQTAMAMIMIADATWKWGSLVSGFHCDPR